MTIPATEAVTGSGMAGLLPASTTAATDESKEMFLQLMVAQLRYQDPMNPADSSEFLAQNAQFTALEKMQAVADQTAMVLQATTAFGASSLVGRDVSYTLSDGTQGTGAVHGVSFGAAGPVLDVGGVDVPLASVLAVTDGSRAGQSSGQSAQSSSTPSDPTTSTV
ncbi:flagellar hook assembly protein FlgD [uncultured Nocardioides sp.]|uniref:flagellar hook assembly protein FlgD n=1 Tax=uncultured Nocardioides sp. TaxID=198441 RepID=UPI00260430A8|nr:flagellar hook capping FlgD N-terminal domain-containing protein [uncultured Nocardioides sp.]